MWDIALCEPWLPYQHTKSAFLLQVRVKQTGCLPGIANKLRERGNVSKTLGQFGIVSSSEIQLMPHAQLDRHTCWYSNLRTCEDLFSENATGIFPATPYRCLHVAMYRSIEFTALTKQIRNEREGLMNYGLAFGISKYFNKVLNMLIHGHSVTHSTKVWSINTSRSSVSHCQYT